MLTVTILGDESWDDEAEKFVYSESTVLEFEHSLVSLSKWEAIYHKPFLTPDAKSEEEMVSYVEAMLMTPNVSLDVLNRMSEENVKALDEYINNPMTGTTITNLPNNSRQSSERLSAELIYFWMNQYQIPYEARYWHLNQLFTLIKVHYAKTQKPEKMSRQKRVQTMAELNAERKKRLGTSG